MIGPGVILFNTATTNTIHSVGYCSNTANRGSHKAGSPRMGRRQSYVGEIPRGADGMPWAWDLFHVGCTDAQTYIPTWSISVIVLLYCNSNSGHLSFWLHLLHCSLPAFECLLTAALYAARRLLIFHPKLIAFFGWGLIFSWNPRPIFSLYLTTGLTNKLARIWSKGICMYKVAKERFLFGPTISCTQCSPCVKDEESNNHYPPYLAPNTARQPAKSKEE